MSVKGRLVCIHGTHQTLEHYFIITSTPQLFKTVISAEIANDPTRLVGILLIRHYTITPLTQHMFFFLMDT